MARNYGRLGWVAGPMVGMRGFYGWPYGRLGGYAWFLLLTLWKVGWVCVVSTAGPMVGWMGMRGFYLGSYDRLGRPGFYGVEFQLMEVVTMMMTSGRYGVTWSAGLSPTLTGTTHCASRGLIYQTRYKGLLIYSSSFVLIRICGGVF